MMIFRWSIGGLIGILSVAQTGCLEIAENIGEDIGEAIECAVDSAIPLNGVDNMGMENASYLLKNDAKNPAAPLISGSEGKLHFIDFTSADLTVSVSEPSVLDVANVHIEDDDCGVWASISTYAEGTAELTVEGTDGKSASWQIDVLSPSEVVFGVQGQDDVAASQTASLDSSDADSPIEISLDVLQADGTALFYLEPAVWRVTEGDDVISIGSILDEGTGGTADEAPTGTSVALTVLAPGTATLEVTIADLVQAELHFDVQ